jgi:hypothetical protein
MPNFMEFLIYSWQFRRGGTTARDDLLRRSLIRDPGLVHRLVGPKGSRLRLTREVVTGLAGSVSNSHDALLVSLLPLPNPRKEGDRLTSAVDVGLDALSGDRAAAVPARYAALPSSFHCSWFPTAAQPLWSRLGFITALKAKEDAHDCGLKIARVH